MHIVLQHLPLGTMPCRLPQHMLWRCKWHWLPPEPADWTHQHRRPSTTPIRQAMGQLSFVEQLGDLMALLDSAVDFIIQYCPSHMYVCIYIYVYIYIYTYTYIHILTYAGLNPMVPLVNNPTAPPRTGYLLWTNRRNLVQQSMFANLFCILGSRPTLCSAVGFH